MNKLKEMISISQTRFANKKRVSQKVLSTRMKSSYTFAKSATTSTTVTVTITNFGIVVTQLSTAGFSCGFTLFKNESFVINRSKNNIHNRYFEAAQPTNICFETI